LAARDFDPEAMAFHAKAAKAMRDVLYAGAEKNCSAFEAPR